MDVLRDIIIVIGLSGVALLWVFSVVGALATIWDTAGDQLRKLLSRSNKG